MINCTITSTAKTDIYRDVIGVTLPAFSGQTQVLPGHAEAFFLLKKGSIVLQRSDKPNESIQIDGGESYIMNDKMVIIL